MGPNIQIVIVTAKYGWLVLEGPNGKVELYPLSEQQIAAYLAMEERHSDERNAMDKTALKECLASFSYGGPVVFAGSQIPALGR